jgi:PAS domain S-box-containing protein
MINENKTYHFLQGGGEMGALTRAFDWSLTSIGTPDKWPQSLRTMVATVLSSKFPMFLWWGNALVQFYNDAYRPSLGNDGKHPLALGQKGEDCWTEIWPVIKPLIDQVRNTKIATWSEDQLIPIYRNGKLEDVYWTFSYSPVFGETENVEGVLVVCNETTDKKKIENALIEGEARFRIMADNVPNLTWMAGADGAIYWYNKRWYEYTGTTIAEMEGWGWQSVHDPVMLPEVLNKWRGAIANGVPFEMTFPIKGADGIFRQFLTRVIPIKDVTGKLLQWLGTNTDINAQVAAEKRLKESEERLRSVIESAPFPIGIYIGKEMRVAFANKAITDAWGKGEDVIGKLYSEILPELGNQEIFDQLEQVYTTGRAYHARNQRVDIVVSGELQPYYFNYSFIPLLDAGGNVFGVTNTAADVTDLNVAKLKVEENERSIRNTILRAPVAMCILRGAEHWVEIANDRMIELWGKTAADVLGKPIFEGLPEAKGQGFEQIVDGVFQTGETFSANGVPVTLPRNGKIEIVYVNFVYEAYRDANNSISGIIAVAVDVTEQVIARRRIEDVVAERTKELADANSNLQKSNAELAQFAYIASHDLQEPVRKISAFAQMLENRLGSVDEKSQSYLEKINVSSARMLNLIRDVLAYSQLAKDNEVFKKVDLNTIFDDVKTDCELLIEQKQAIIERSALPVLEAIPLQMSQLFTNLISNALKFSKKDVPPFIIVTADVLTEEEVANRGLPASGVVYYNLQFNDNGIGFNEACSEQIFNIFQRLHGKTEYAGTGIGLAMCRKIVENHHGDIYATGSSDKGAVFNVLLPQRQVL